MSPVFVDTGAFAALADRNDRHHRDAKRLLRRLGRERRPLVTSTYVIDELLTLVRMRVGYAAAVRIGERLMQTRWCIVEVGAGFERINQSGPSTVFEGVSDL